MSFLCFSIYSQKNRGIGVEINGKNKKADSGFIKKTYERLQFRFDVNTISTEFMFTNKRPLRDFSIIPNQDIKFRVAAGYRWLNLAFSFAPSIGGVNSDEDTKGNTDIFDFGLKLNFNKLQQKVFFRNTSGYYVDNTGDYRPDLSSNGINSKYLILPDFKSVEFGIENYYYFNGGKYSSRFIRNHSEIQTKSIGSIVAFSGNYYSELDGRNQDFQFLNFLPEVQTTYANRIRSFYSVLGVGYGYNLIINNKFFIAGQMIPLMGLQLSKSEFSDGVTSVKSTDLTIGGLSEISTGINSDKWFGGVYFSYANYTSPTADIQISGEQAFMMFFVGYRLKAPKGLKNSFDTIENTFSKFLKKF